MTTPDTSGELRGPAPPQPIGTSRHIPIIVAGVFAVSLLKGLRMPNLWAATHMTFNYTQGFIRRGLFGQILLMILGTRVYRYNTLALIAVILFVLAVLVMARLTRRMLATDDGDRALIAAALIFGASPGIVFVAHAIGYLDYVGFIAVPLFITWAAHASRLWTVFHVAVALSVVLALVHESMLIMFAPTLWLVMVCHIVAQGRARAITRGTRRVLAVHAVVAVAVALVASPLIGLLGTKSPARIQTLQGSIGALANFPLRGDAFQVLYSPVRDNLVRVIPLHWSFPDNRRYLVTGLFASLPGIIILAIYGVRLVTRLPVPRATRALLGAIFLTATFAPLSLNLIGWDSARWNAICFFAAFCGIATLRLFFCTPAAAAAVGLAIRRFRVDDPWMLTLAAAAIVFGLTTNYTNFLFDGYTVQWFPFDGQLRALLDLLHGGFRFIPAG